MKHLTHLGRRAEANFPGNLRDRLFAVEQLSLGTFNAQASDLCCDGAPQMFAKAVLEGSRPSPDSVGDFLLTNREMPIGCDECQGSSNEFVCDGSEVRRSFFAPKPKAE